VLDADRRLALAYVPASRRAALEALWRLDVIFASVLATGRDEMVTRIRLAWWREALERLDTEPPPAEPVLRALAEHVVPAGIGGAALAAMEAGWEALISDTAPTPQDLAAYARARGGRLFRYSALVLGDPDFPVEAAGRLWALADLARRSANPREAQAALDAAEAQVVAKWPGPLRPLGMLAALAWRDVARRGESWERQGSPARMLRMIRHRLTGI